MIDSHCHFDTCAEPFDGRPGANPDDLIARAHGAGVSRVLAIGMNGGSCRHALRLAERNRGIYVSVGRHPHETEDWDEAGAAELAELASHPKVRAIGETGLDYKRDYAPRTDQRAAFADQIDLARELGKPLVVHTRYAQDDTLGTLAERARGLDVIVHCFSLTDRLDDCIERGYCCSFAGNVTYPNAKELQAAAARVPDELLLVETDAPFLPPQRWRGKPNEPAHVTSIAEFVAELRGTSYAQLEAIVERNAARLFDW